MQYHLINLIHADLIEVGVRAADDEEAIRALCGLLAHQGYTQPEYGDAVVQRERAYPTGLPTSPFAVAIPHADPEYILQTGVAIGVLTEPASFGQMGTDGSVRVDAAVVIVLAIKEHEKQTEMLQELVELLQSEDFLTALVRAQTPADVLRVIETALI